MHLTVGDVIRWDGFKYPRDGDIKARWFIYLGRSSLLSSPIFSYLCTTTTQLQHFGQGNSRANHVFRRFTCQQHPVFDQDCILDFTEELYDIPTEKLDECQRLIEIKGRLGEEDMRNAYNQFLKVGTVSPRVMLDIHESFNLAGITGLKKPK